MGERKVPRENVYTCQKCGGYTVTVDVDEGVTPFMLGCRADGTEHGCDGPAYSAGYPKGPRPAHIPEPAWEWYRPTPKEQKKMDKKWPGYMDHFNNGGLAIRKRKS